MSRATNKGRKRAQPGRRAAMMKVLREHTHLGPFLGLPPTGRKVKVRAAVVWQFRRGRIRGESIYFDMGSVLEQIGARIKVRKSGARS